MCFVTVVVQSRLATLDRSLEEAAMDLGCDPLRAFLAVTLPLILPSIAAGWMLAFTLSLDDVVIASFTTGPGSATLPIRIYSEVRLGVKPEINAICTLVIGLDHGGDRGGVVRLEVDQRAGRERGAAVGVDVDERRLIASLDASRKIAFSVSSSDRHEGKIIWN